VEQVGVHENFFELGGHSLLATQVISRIREAFSVELPLRVIFESPSVSELATSVETALRAGEEIQSPSMKRVKLDGELPLSFAQERLWFIDQLEPNSSLYNCPGAVRLTGRLNAEALQQCLSEIVRRHEALRTTFATLEGKPIQVIAPPLPLSLPLIDLSDLPEKEREAEAARLAYEEGEKPFDLAAGPLLRVSLVRLAEQEHLVLFTMHHIISDGWSISVLVREVAVLYDAFSRGAPSPLPELPIQYADFAVWQREWLRGEVLERQLSYWREQLKGAPPVLELPTDRARPAVQSYRGANESLELPEELILKIRKLSSQEGVTLFMFLLAAFKVLLYRYTGQPDVVVGTPIAGRHHTEIEALIGFFVNTLVLRTDLSGTPSFAELLSRVREVSLNAYAHQDVPFEKLVEELNPERSLNYTPLIQVVFRLQNLQQEALELPGLSLSTLGAETVTAKFDLIHTVTETDQGLIANLHYNTDLFDAMTVQRMLKHFRTLLESIVANPEQKIYELPLMDEEEAQQLLVGWNNNHTEDSPDTCVHQMFEAQAELAPDKVAVMFEDGRLTYRELNERADQLAHHLQALGVGPESTVGLFFERGFEMIVGILGVLKAGGACVPLDPSYPHKRLGFMLDNSGVEVLLTEQRLVPALPEHQAQVVCLDADWPSISVESKADTRGAVGAQNLAYVLYTSGSTGVPKGVLLHHRGLVNRLRAGQKAYDLSADDRVLHKASFSFDASLWEIFWPLTTGARLVLARPGGQQDSAYLAEAVERQGVTIMHFVPSMLQVFLEESGLESRCAGLRRMFCGGEVLPVELVGRFFEKIGASLHNQYGPTETSVSVLYWTCRRGEEPRTIPIGRPFVNLRLYVLDEYMQPVVVGVKGELYIGGAGVTRGYMNRPDLTAERYVPDAFGSVEGERLYRTGDRVRYLPDGTVEFLGRVDHQLKIRGFRVELGEIKALLAEHPAIREAFVLAREDVPGGAQRLVAYLVASQDEEPPTGGELRGYLKERLPDYMIPSAFVFLEAMPLTPNNKVDHRALPAPEQTRPELEVEFMASRTPVEEALASLWTYILGVEQIGINDNFFELGGHSLLATQVISRVRETFKIELPLRKMFESPTISELAEHIEAAVKAGQGVEAPLIVAAGRDGTLPLAYSQERLWFIDQLDPGSPVYNIGTAIRLDGQLDMDALQQTFDEIIRRHEVLRTSFAASQGQPQQVISPAGTFAISLTDLSAWPEKERDVEARRLAREEALLPFDLSKGPLLRVSLLRLDEDVHLVLFTMHHIISDGWSISVLVREVAVLYDAFSRGETSPLPELPIQYADFAVWQREWLRGEVLERQLSYWREQLKGAPPVLELPTDRARPAVQSYRGAQHSFAVSAEVSEQLNELSQREGVTLYMTLLALFKVLLYHYAKRPDIVLGASIANRNRSETEGLIGFFVNMLVTRTDLSGNPSFRELLNRVQEVALGAYAHQDVPFEKLVEELRPERDLSYNPLFQVAFVLQNAPMSTLELAGLVISPVEKGKEISIFDLLLEVAETPEGMRGTFTYSTDLWDAPTIEHMATLYQTLLSKVANDSNPSLSAMEETLCEMDRQQQNARQSDYKQARRLKLKNLQLKSIAAKQP
jgi:amino acid adenylation domain-containing protein